MGCVFGFPKKKDYHVFEFERYIVYRFGKNAKAYGPGYILLLDPRPSTGKPEDHIDDVKKIVDMREKCHVMQPLEVKTSDHINIKVQGICFYEIFDPIKGVLSCEGQDVDRFIETRALSLLRDAAESYNLITLLRKQQDLQNKMRDDGRKEMIRYGTRITRILINSVEIVDSEFFEVINIRQATMIQQPIKLA